MRIIYKYELRAPGCRTLVKGVDLTGGDSAVHVGADPRGVLCVWIEHKDASRLPPDRTSFTVYATGMVIPDGETHVGSFIDGAYVWHVYASDAE